MASDESKEGSTTAAGTKGEYVRKASSFRDWIKADGSTPFAPEAGRYVLYVALGCPFAHRTLLVRKLKGLEDVIETVVVHHHLGPEGWRFLKEDEEDEWASADTVNGCACLGDIYRLANPEYTGKYTVPTLWDKKLNTIVNNESSEILRMLNSEFNEFVSEEGKAVDLYPVDLRSAIDAVNDWVYPNINNGVYRCGFARTQEAYDEAFDQLFEALDRVEGMLEHSRFLTGNRLTEADIRLFVTLLRFDAAYLVLFKTNKRRIVDYPNMWGYVRDIYSMPGVSDTVVMEHIKKTYYGSMKQLNPSGIVAKGPETDFSAPHDRDTRTYE